MDSVIKSLFELIPEPWRPYVALALLILYVVTKARSAAKNKQIKKLIVIIQPKPKEGERSILPHMSWWRRIVDVVF